MTFSLLVPPHKNTYSIYDWYWNALKDTIVINPNKCVFGAKELDFFDHHIDHNGITPLKDKVQAICNYPLPDSQRKLQQFIGLVNFYHRFLPHGAELIQPLHALLTTKVPDHSLA